MKSQDVLYASARTVNSTSRDSWRTPPEVIEAVKEIYGGTIDLDPCADINQAHWFATYNYNGGGGDGFGPNGLERSWEGKCYVNFPYSKAREWCRHIEASAFTEAMIVLMPARTDTKAWKFATKRSTAVLFFDHRLKFIGGKHSAPFPSALIFIGNFPGRFIQIAPRLGGQIWRK